MERSRGWQPVFYRGRAAGHRRSGPDLKLVSIFVDNLPYDMDPKGMFNMFSKFGVVKHAFISFKRSKVGTRFGFVRYECVVAAKMAIQKANGVWCGKKQLKVKFADYVNGKRYHRTVPGVDHVTSQRVERVAEDGSKQNAFNVPGLKGIGVSTSRGIKSYADIVKEGVGEASKLLKVAISDEGSEWLQRCMVVRIKSMSMLGELQRLIWNNKLQEIHFRFGGGNLILLNFPTEAFLHQKYRLVADLIQKLCDDIRLWDEKLPMETSRLVWLHCYGIPFHAWNTSTLQSIGSLWGEVIRLEDNLVESKSLNCGKVLVHTRSMEAINSSVEVECNKRIFKISVGEGCNSVHFDCEMRQKWGLNFSSPTRSESSVAGDNPQQDDRIEAVQHTAAVDQKQPGKSFEEVEPTVAVDQKQHGNSALVASDHGNSVSVVKDTFADCDFVRDVGIEQMVSNVRKVGIASELGFMRSFSGSIGPCHGINLEIVLNKPTVLNRPQPPTICLIEEIEGNGLLVNGPVVVSGHASVGSQDVISGEASGLANCPAAHVDVISSSSSFGADSPEIHSGLDAGMGKGGSKAPSISEKGYSSGMANRRAVEAEAKSPSQDDEISSSSSLCAKPPELHKGLDLGMGKGGSKAPRNSEKGKSKKRSQGERVKNHKTIAQKGATIRAAVAAYSLASASQAGPSKGQIILDEAQATIRMGKLLGIDFEGQEDEVLQKIIELEQMDAERVEKRKKSQASIKSTIERYKKAVADNSNPCPTPEINAQFYQQESKKLRQQIQMIQNTNRSLMGEGLDCLNMKELKQLENRLERGITRIRSKKHEMILAETENLQKREMELENENAFLRAKIAETERIQEQNMVPGEEYNAIQAYFARNDLVLQLNILDAEHPPPPAAAAYQRFDKKSLHLG